MQLLKVRHVLCRKAYNGKRHLLTLLVDIQKGGQVVEHPVSFFKLWSCMGWRRWSRRRVAAVVATAPAQVQVWWTRRRGQPWAELLHTTYEPWCARIRNYLDAVEAAPDEPSALEVAADAAIVVFQQNSSSVEPFVLDVSAHA